MTTTQPLEQKQQRKRGVRTQEARERLVNQPKTLLSTLKPLHSSALTAPSEDRTKPLGCPEESVVAVWYALYLTLDTATGWTRGVRAH